jgi:hypothetical protein
MLHFIWVMPKKLIMDGFHPYDDTNIKQRLDIVQQFAVACIF